MNMVLEERICPRCGNYINYLEKRVHGNSIYFLAVHKWRGKDGKIHVHKCYLGKNLEAKFLPVNLYLSQMDLGILRDYFVSRKRIPKWKREKAKELFDKIFNTDRNVIIKKI